MPNLTNEMKYKSKKKKIWSSSQDGVIGRYAWLPSTPKRRTTTNLKTKNNQNCHKIELYGSPTTSELKKKHSSTLGGSIDMGSWGREDMWQRGKPGRQGGG